MAGVSMTFKFSLFTLAILFGLLAPSSSSEFYDEELEERDDVSYTFLNQFQRVKLMSFEK